MRNGNNNDELTSFYNELCFIEISQNNARIPRRNFRKHVKVKYYNLKLMNRQKKKKIFTYKFYYFALIVYHTSLMATERRVMFRSNSLLGIFETKNCGKHAHDCSQTHYICGKHI